MLLTTLLNSVELQASNFMLCTSLDFYNIFLQCRYGDTTAKSVPGRIFAVVWILTGLCLYSILIGDLSSSLSATVSVSKTILYGAKVPAGTAR
jgi:hypothetical protein